MRCCACIPTFLGRFVRPWSFLAITAIVVGAFVTHILMNETGVRFDSSLHAAQAKQKFAAADLDGGTDWLNTAKPLKLADLKGRIVLLDFWTLCCINCIHTLPDLAKLEEKYPGELVVIGVHSPKFDNEKDTESIRKAILRYEIKHPVVNDADHKIWNALRRPLLADARCSSTPRATSSASSPARAIYEVLDQDIEKLVKEYKGKKTSTTSRSTSSSSRRRPTARCSSPARCWPTPRRKRLFIADSTHHRIVITDLDGKKIAIAGTGIEGFKDGTFAEAQFNDPQGMALDGDTLYVADRKNHCIRALDLKAQTVKTVAGTGEQDRMAATAAAPRSRPA